MKWKFIAKIELLLQMGFNLGTNTNFVKPILNSKKEGLFCFFSSEWNGTLHSIKGVFLSKNFGLRPQCKPVLIFLVRLLLGHAIYELYYYEQKDLSYIHGRVLITPCGWQARFAVSCSQNFRWLTAIVIHIKCMSYPQQFIQLAYSMGKSGFNNVSGRVWRSKLIERGAEMPISFYVTLLHVTSIQWITISSYAGFRIYKSTTSTLLLIPGAM